MQKLIFTDGVEFFASDFTFWASAIEAAFTNRTQMWAGAGGVFSGGVVGNGGGLVATVSGPLKAHANGQYISIAVPANQTLTASATNYIIAVYQTTDDTPATFYGAGSPPNKHRNDTPTIINRTSGPAVLANGEIDLATVVTGASTITTITDTRIILPSTDNSGNILLGALKTIDGMDPSVHQTLIGTPTIAAHLKLGAPGGATPYSVLGGAWQKDEFIDVASALPATYVLNDSDFTSPPASSQPFASGLGPVYITTYVPTRNGDLVANGYGPHVCTRYTLTFTATSVQQVTVGLTAWDDTIRVKGNGTQLYSASAANGGTYQVLTFNTVVGTNTIQIYHGNTDGNQFYLYVACNALTLPGITFTG